MRTLISNIENTNLLLFLIFSLDALFALQASDSQSRTPIIYGAQCLHKCTYKLNSFENLL